MRRTSTGLFALFALGGYYLYRNRFRVQQFLESYGIHLPIDTSSVTNAVRSGVAKVSGQIQGAVGSSGEDISKAV